MGKILEHCKGRVKVEYCDFERYHFVGSKGGQRNS